MQIASQANVNKGKEPGRPLFRADQVGSLLRPAAVVAAFKSYQAGHCSEDSLRKIQDDAIISAVRRQESLGLQSITDGEFRRRGWQRGFSDATGGFVIEPTRLSWKDDDGLAKAPQQSPRAVRRIRRTKGIVTDDFKFLRSVTDRCPKVTMPAPSLFHWGHFSGGIDKQAYPDVDQYFDDLIQVYRAEIAELASLGCTLLQIDDTPLAHLCDQQNRDVVTQIGEDPEALIDLYIRLINNVVAERPASMAVGLHLCRGNQQGLHLADGDYAPIAARLFNETTVDTFFLEYDTARAGNFEPLSEMPKTKSIILGLLSTKYAQLESDDFLKRRIDEASKFIPLGQLGLSPQCGFASAALSPYNVTTNPMTPDIQWKKLEIVVKVARDVWGD